MQHTKHIHVLHLLSIIPVGPYGRAMATRDEAIACWDHIFHYIHEHWPVPLSGGLDVDGLVINGPRPVAQQQEIRDCQELLKNGHEVYEKISTLPPHYGEVIFPVAVGMYLLRNLALDFHPKWSRTFNEFHRRYGTMILNGY